MRKVKVLGILIIIGISFQNCSYSTQNEAVGVNHDLTDASTLLGTSLILAEPSITNNNQILLEISIPEDNAFIIPGPIFCITTPCPQNLKKVSLSYKLQNLSNEDIIFTFPSSGPEIEVSILDMKGVVIFSSIDGFDFAQVLTYVTVKANEEIIFSEELELSTHSQLPILEGDYIFSVQFKAINASDYFKDTDISKEIKITYN
jgi:hypothetical protein